MSRLENSIGGFSRVSDRLVIIGFLLLLSSAVLVSGGARAIGASVTMYQEVAAPTTEADSSCPPCLAARRAKLLATEQDDPAKPSVTEAIDAHSDD